MFLMLNTSTWHSYPKVWNIGHPKASLVLEGDIVVQEKYDGSQFSFGVIEGELKVRSRGREFHPDNPEKLFKPTVDHITSCYEKGLLTEGWTYRGEALCRPKHNTIQYSRIPLGNFVLFDIEIGYCRFMPCKSVVEKAHDLGVEPVYVYNGVDSIKSLEGLKSLLENESSLGGSSVEGIVVKNYERFTNDGKVLMAKYVSESFKELHRQNPDWKNSKKDIIEIIGGNYNTPGRFEKAVYRVRDNEGINYEPQDIGKILKNLSTDLEEEQQDVIKDALYDRFRKDIIRKANRGFAEWYKDFLAKRQFGGDTNGS